MLFAEALILFEYLFRWLRGCTIVVLDTHHDHDDALPHARMPHRSPADVHRGSSLQVCRLQ